MRSNALSISTFSRCESHAFPACSPEHAPVLTLHTECANATHVRPPGLAFRQALSLREHGGFRVTSGRGKPPNAEVGRGHVPVAVEVNRAPCHGVDSSACRRDARPSAARKSLPEKRLGPMDVEAGVQRSAPVGCAPRL